MTAGVAEHLVGLALGDLGAVVEHDHVLRELVHDFEIVLDQDHRDAGEAQAVDHRDREVRLGGVQPGHDLVEQQELRVPGERPSDL